MWVIGWGGCAVGRGSLCGSCLWVAGCGGRRGSHGGGVRGGRVWVFGRGGEARVAGPGAVPAGWRVWATGWREEREWLGAWSGVRVRYVGVRVRLHRRACAVSCRSGGLQLEFAVHRGCSGEFTDACAYSVHLLVGGWERVFQGWAEAHEPEDCMVSVVPAGEGLLWPGGAEQRSRIGQQKIFCCTLCTIKPSDEHGDETENIVSLQTVINVYHKYDTSLQIKQYQIIQCMYMRPMGWGPGYTPPLKKKPGCATPGFGRVLQQRCLGSPVQTDLLPPYLWPPAGTTP